MGRIGEGIDVTAIAIVVYEVLCSQSLTRKERADMKVRLLGMIHMMWRRGLWIILSGYWGY